MYDFKYSENYKSKTDRLIHVYYHGQFIHEQAIHQKSYKSIKRTGYNYTPFNILLVPLPNLLIIK